jgi:hypothetical protein
MFAFTNSGGSCYMDSLLVALFFPHEHRRFYERLMLVPQPLQPGTQPESWEARMTDSWRRNVLASLRHDIDRLHDEPTQGWPLDAFRYLLSAVPFSPTINFGHPGQQSAVDFFRYFLAVCNVRDTLLDFQTSSTFYKARPAVDARVSSVPAMLDLWTKSQGKRKWTHQNAQSSTLKDEEERRALLQDSTGAASFSVNEDGDRRRISALQHMSLVLCQLTAMDTEVPIERGVLPHIELPGDGYTGSLGATLHAQRLLRVPVLIFEVSRRVYTPDGAEHKSPARVAYGAVTPDKARIVLTVLDQPFALEAVVCHYGSTSSGHYIAFVQRLPGEWYVYDDAFSPQLRLLEDGAAGVERVGAPSLNGELFFYVPLVQ